MVQQMIDAKFNEYGLANVGTGISTHDKQPPISIKKTPLRDLQNESVNMITKPQNNSPLPKGKGLPLDDAKICGSKRPVPNCLPSPCNSSPPCTNASNGHLVYVRRKVESEPGKTNAANLGTANRAQPVKSATNTNHESPKQESTMQEDPKISCFPAFTTFPAASLSPFSSVEPSVSHSLGKPGNGFPSGEASIHHTFGKTVNGLMVQELNHPPVATGMPFLVSPQGQNACIQQPQERFDRLQAFLKSHDSNEDDYIKMLRSLSAAGRSRCAFELEKRAIVLSLEEGKEFQRVMYLNVLGKSVSKNHMPAVQSHFHP